MTRALALLWIAVLAVATTATCLTTRAASTARRHAAGRVDGFRALAGKAGALAELRAQRPTWSAPTSAATDTGLATSISAVLSSCGLPATTLSSLSPESGAAGPVEGTGDVKVQRQRSTLTLVQITLPQLGGFLEAWRRREPAWVCSSIEIAPESNKPAAAGADLPLRVVLALESLRLRGSGDTRP